MAMKVPEIHRNLYHPQLGTKPSDGCNGLFILPAARGRSALQVICSDGTDWAKAGFDPPAWEHVSVAATDGKRATRCPNWNEMCYVKSLFWDDEDTVIQFHPPKKDYVDFHPYVLHLWRPVGIELPRPPHITVGPKPEEIR